MLAIAGLHMALVGLGLYWVVRAVLAAVPNLALRFSIKKWAATAALCSSAYYLMISGATSASTRAFIMLAMMLFAILFDRPAISMRSLALAATIILVLGPESLIEPGFQMSFAAVMSLIAIAEWEGTRPRREVGLGNPALARVRRYLRGISTTSLVGSIATIPFAIYHFDRATHYAVLGNLLAMPIMGFVVMPAAALSMFLMPLGLDAWSLRVMAWGIEVMLAVGRWVSSLPGAVSVMPAWPTSALVLVSRRAVDGALASQVALVGGGSATVRRRSGLLGRSTRSHHRSRRNDNRAARAERRIEAAQTRERFIFR